MKYLNADVRAAISLMISIFTRSQLFGYEQLNLTRTQQFRYDQLNLMS